MTEQSANQTATRQPATTDGLDALLARYESTEALDVAAGRVLDVIDPLPAHVPTPAEIAAWDQKHVGDRFE